MRRRRNAQEEMIERLVRAGLPRAHVLARSGLVPVAAEAGILAERAWRRRRTPEQRDRRRKEDEARRVLRSHDVAGAGRPHAFWHESGDGPVVLLLNGWTASGLMWPRALVDDLAADHRVVRVDNRGTGYARTAPTPFRMADLADDAADVLERVGGGPAVVVGVSMGGMIAQELALRHPRLVRLLVLVASRPPAPAQVHARADVVRSVLDPPSTRGDEVVAMLCGEGFAASNPHLFEEAAAQAMERVTPRATVHAQMRAIAAWGRPHRLRSIRCPTVVIHGSADRLSPVRNGVRLARLIRGARYVELPGVGHLVPMEAPDAIARAVRGD